MGTGAHHSALVGYGLESSAAVSSKENNFLFITKYRPALGVIRYSFSESIMLIA
jgi:hypothetical protein